MGRGSAEARKWSPCMMKQAVSLIHFVQPPTLRIVRGKRLICFISRSRRPGLEDFAEFVIDGSRIGDGVGDFGAEELAETLEQAVHGGTEGTFSCVEGS